MGAAMLGVLLVAPAQAAPAPCYPAVSCNPSVSVAPGATASSGVTLTVDNLLPGSTVTFTWTAGGQTHTQTATVGTDGTVTVTLGPVDAGTTPILVAGQTTGANGQPVPVTRTATVTVVEPTQALSARLRAVSHATQLKLIVDTLQSVQSSSVRAQAACAGPFNFQLQKRTVTTINQGSDEPIVRVTWTTLPKHYATNRTTATTAYRVINKGKGTYRAVVEGKCSLLGVTTNTAKLRK